MSISTAIATTTVATNMPNFAKLPTMSSTLITEPAIMKQTPIGVTLIKLKLIMRQVKRFHFN